MTLSDLASIGSFASGVAVFITLIFLTFQLRQNTTQMRRNELNSAQAQFAGFRFAIVNNRDVAQLWVTGAKDGALDEVDEARYSTLLDELFWSVFNVWERHNRGIAADVPGAIPFLAMLLTSRRGNAAWQEHQQFFPPEFVSAVDGAVRTAPRHSQRGSVLAPVGQIE